MTSAQEGPGDPDRGGSSRKSQPGQPVPHGHRGAGAVRSEYVPGVRRLPTVVDMKDPDRQASFGSALKAAIGGEVLSQPGPSASWSSVPSLLEITAGQRSDQGIQDHTPMHSDGRTGVAGSLGQVGGDRLSSVLGQFATESMVPTGTQMSAEESLASFIPERGQGDLPKAGTITSGHQGFANRLTELLPQPAVSSGAALGNSTPRQATGVSPGQTGTAVTSASVEAMSQVSASMNPAQRWGVGQIQGEVGPGIQGVPPPSHQPFVARLASGTPAADSIGPSFPDSVTPPSSTLTGLLRPFMMSAPFGYSLTGSESPASETGMATSSWGPPPEERGLIPGASVGYGFSESGTSPGSRETSPSVDMTKTNELLQQLLDEFRRGRQPFLPVQNKAIF
jgi:hypothetical protein